MEQIDTSLSNVLSTLHGASLTESSLHRVSDEVLILKELARLTELGPDDYSAPCDTHAAISLLSAKNIQDPWPIINSICKESNEILEAASRLGFYVGDLMNDDNAEDALKATRIFKEYSPYSVAFIIITAGAFGAQTEFEVKLAMKRVKPTVFGRWSLKECWPQAAALAREHYRSLLKVEMEAHVDFYPDDW